MRSPLYALAGALIAAVAAVLIGNFITWEWSWNLAEWSKAERFGLVMLMTLGAFAGLFGSVASD
jgi:hypothetical protein